MAEGRTTQMAAAAGVAAATGAAQLGLGYGLGVVLWPDIATTDNSVWLGSLGWATWIAASSTVFGAVFASRFGSRGGGPWRFALAASAAVGALLTVALIALPARAAVRADTYTPETIAAGYALVGVLFGLLLAYWAVVSRPVAANLTATAAWLWAMAVASVVVELTLHRDSAMFLTSWQFADTGEAVRYGAIYWPSSALTLLAALIIGVIGALPAARRGEHGVGAAAAGATGPLLVAASFFVMAPQLTGTLGPLESAYLIAPYAVLTGLAGSAATIALAKRAAARRKPAAPQPNPARSAAAGVAPEASERRLRLGSSTGTAARPDSEEVDARRISTADAPLPPAVDPWDLPPTAEPRPAQAPPTRVTEATKNTATPDNRSTVAPPPASPPIVKINPPRSGETTAPKPATRPGPSKPGPSKAVPSKAAPAKAAPAKTTPAKAHPSKQPPAPDRP